MFDVRRVRTVHHLSSSGGTIIAKAIAALPRVVLLSEMNPSNRVRLLHPVDPLPQMLANYPELMSHVDVEKVFLERMSEVQTACARHNRLLVVRDHSHFDFLRRNVQKPRLRAVLGQSFEIVSVATIRNPVDTWLSMLDAGFAIDLPSFTAYCDRVKMFVDAYADIPMLKYEDFCAASADTVEKIAAALDLPFDPAFESRIGAIRITGDSGRLSRSRSIQSLPRRPVPDGLAAELRRPENRTFLEQIGYSIDADV